MRQYDPAKQSVTLQLVRPLPLGRTYSLTVAGAESSGLTSAAGTPLGGAGTGQPGSDYVVRINRETLTVRPGIQLLRNGGFETPRVPRWSKAVTLFAGSNALVPWQISSGSVNVETFWPTSQGTHNLDLNGTSPSAILQSFATTPGKTYQLSFEYANNPDKPNQTDYATVTVTGSGTLLSRWISHTGSTPRHMKYNRFLGTFVADSATTTLEFVSTTLGAYGIVLDAVAVKAV